MFDEFLRNCPMEDEVKPSNKRVKRNIAAVKSLVEKEGASMTKRRFRLKTLIITAAIAAIAIFSVVSLLTVNGDVQGDIYKFSMGGEEIEGEYNDYVDNDGFRHVSFRAVLPIYEQNFALIYDVDAPRGENVRVITDETDPDFMDRIHQYLEAQDEHLEAYKAWKAEREAEHEESDFDSEDVTITESDEKFELPPEPEDFGLVLKDSELCSYSAGYVTRGDFSLKSGFFGGRIYEHWSCRAKAPWRQRRRT